LFRSNHRGDNDVLDNHSAPGASHRLGAPSRAALAALALIAAVALIPALAAAAKPKDGGYIQSDENRGISGYVATSDGKVLSGGAYLKFKAKGGGKCKSDVIKTYTNKGVTGVSAVPKKAGKVKNGKFKISGNTPEGFTTTISGKFKSSEKAKLKVKSKVQGCTAKASFKNAKYTSGG